MTNASAVAVKSPLSPLPPIKIRDLSRAFILEQLELYYGAEPPAGAVEGDYSIWKCSETAFEFAWPMLPGNACFYEWVSHFPSYYPGIRWEYGEVGSLIRSLKPAGGPLEVLDAGCGKGDFLRGLDWLPAEKRYALDLNKPAVEACRKEGFQAFCGTMEHALEAGFIRASQFPVVTSFHCLEHVDQPVEFVRSLAKATAPGGRILLSTPYSPMSFESEWFDILNHPPHHLTRWNLNAYKKLGAMLGLKLRYFCPPSKAAKRAVAIFRHLHHGPHRRVGRARLCADLLLHFHEAVRLYRQQRERGRSDGVSADVILVEFAVS